MGKERDRQVSASQRQEKRVSEMRKDIDPLNLIVTAIGQIAQAAYGADGWNISYKHHRTENGLEIRFHHSSADHIEDADNAATYNRDFYMCLRRFLQDLDGLEKDLSVMPYELKILAKDEALIVDALEEYLSDERYTLQMADDDVMDFGGLEDKSSTRRYLHIMMMAEQARQMLKEDPESFDYYLASAKAAPFISRDYYDACVAARASADITISLRHIRMLIGQSPDVPKSLKLSAKDDLIASFRDCAQWDRRPPERPPGHEESLNIITRQIHIQIATAIRELLSANYGLRHEILNKMILMGVSMQDKSTCALTVSCHNVVSKEAFDHCFEKAVHFSQDLLQASSGIEFVEFLPTSGQDLFKIRYTPQSLARAVESILLMKQLENLTARAHLRTLPLLYERIHQNVPANALN